MTRDERGYVTVEHAVCFVAVTLVIGVLVAAGQAGMTGSSLCQAVREGARAASIGEADPWGVATASFPSGSYTVTRGVPRDRQWHRPLWGCRRMGRRAGALHGHNNRRGGPVVRGERRARWGNGGSEEGSGTINCLGLIALALTLSVLLAGIGAARTASVRLQAVADLAALAGAEHSVTARWEDVGDRPCSAAASVAQANGTDIETCEVRGSDCRVVLSEAVVIMGVRATLRARARAGSVT